MTNSTQSLQDALHHLEIRYKNLREEIHAVEQGMSGIRAVLARDASLLVQIPRNSGPQHIPISPSGRYAGMSVRWGVLQYLAEDATEPASTAEIAGALLGGGMTTNGRDFISNVSAVISVMVNKRGELNGADGKYRLTDNGRAAWTAITGTNQYQARSLDFSPSLQ